LKRLPENFTEIADLDWMDTGSNIYLTYRIWVLGDKFLASGFKNAVMKEIWSLRTIFKYRVSLTGRGFILSGKYIAYVALA
jgi:hypothetical protein